MRTILGASESAITAAHLPSHLETTTSSVAPVASVNAISLRFPSFLGHIALRNSYIAAKPPVIDMKSSFAKPGAFVLRPRPLLINGSVSVYTTLVVRPCQCKCRPMQAACLGRPFATGRTRQLQPAHAARLAAIARTIPRRFDSTFILLPAFPHLPSLPHSRL